MEQLPDRVKLGKTDFNGAWLRSVTEKQAVKTLPHLDKNQVINAWKQANGLKKPNYAKVIAADPSEEKPKKVNRKKEKEEEK